MWTEINLSEINFKINEWYTTALMFEGEPYNVQEMKFKHGLWWTSEENYSYYRPTHFWRD